MHELPPENQNENPEKIDFEELSFEELKEASEKIAELSKSSFEETENGFVNINGDKITIVETRGKYKISSISNRLSNFHFHILHGSYQQIEKGLDDKEKMMLEIRKMIEETGNRIIE
ncbi:hypothetical protein KAT63_03345 [Candidatus Parcubacteria bacterium]|nr:hypothetical protein [Candidatus Parcubacteria bacterium]